jgi:hypothetical protein
VRFNKEGDNKQDDTLRAFRISVIIPVTIIIIIIIIMNTVIIIIITIKIFSGKIRTAV